MSRLSVEYNSLFGIICKYNPNSIMINHNPYNLPERPPHKPNRILTETNSAQYRKNDSVDNSTSFPHYANRPPIMPGHQMGPTMKKSSMNMDEMNAGFRPPIYQAARGEFQPFLPNPKSQHSSSASNLTNLTSLANGSSPRTSMNLGSSREKKEHSSNNASIRQSFGISFVQFRQLSEKVDSLNYSLHKNEKRIRQLEKNAPMGGNFLSNNSCSLHEEGSIDILNNYSVRNGDQLQDGLARLRIDIEAVKEDIRTICLKPSQIDRMITEKVRPYSDMCKTMQSSRNSTNSTEQLNSLRKQMETMRNDMQEKMRKNHEFLTSVIGRLERQLQNQTHFMQPQNTFKSSALKCSGSAILLRFVEAFKVRKNNSTAKNGQIKITLTDNTYYIDQEGYLLDKQQNYLVDARGQQVRLEQKHVRILKEQSILQ